MDEMSKLKPCPFCGKMPRGILGGYLACANQSWEICGVSVQFGAWNTRPIEDKLLSQLTARDALIERLIEAGDAAVRKLEGLVGITDEWIAIVAEYQAMKGGEKNAEIL